MSGSQEISFTASTSVRQKSIEKRKPQTAYESPKKQRNIPRVASTQEARKTVEIKAIERYEATKQKQSAELLSLLDKEQEAESYRELKLSAITDEEQHQKLDHEFGIERAKASERIIKMSEAHDRNLRKLAAKLKIKPSPN